MFRLVLVFKWLENSLIAKKIDLRFNKNELVTNCDHLRNAIKFNYINPMVLQWFIIALLKKNNDLRFIKERK